MSKELDGILKKVSRSITSLYLELDTKVAEDHNFTVQPLMRFAQRQADQIEKLEGERDEARSLLSQEIKTTTKLKSQLQTEKERGVKLDAVHLEVQKDLKARIKELEKAMEPVEGIPMDAPLAEVLAHGYRLILEPEGNNE